MSVPAQGAVISIAPQPSKIGEGGTFTVSSRTWHKYRVPRFSGGAQQISQVFPQELGGLIVATGTYKSGKFFAAELDIIPRLENTFGYLLYAALGNVSSVTGARFTASGFIRDVTGVNAHLFRFDPASSYSLPWLAVRRTIPGASASDNTGEVGFDCKLNSLRFTFPGAGLATARVSVIGRDTFEENATDTGNWSYNENFEDTTSAAQSGRGSLSIYGTSPVITSLTVDVMNNITTPQQEMIIGQFTPDDFVPLTRGCTFRAVYKWADPGLYRKIKNGGAANLTWDVLPYNVKTAANVRAFQAEFGSAALISGSNPSQPYRLKIFADHVSWMLDQAGVELQAGGLISMPFIGTALDPNDSTLSYIQIALENLATSYSWT